MNTNIFIDYDNIKLRDISEKIANYFINNNYNVTILNNNLSQTDKINQIKRSNNTFVLSNKLSNNNDLEIVYPLRDNDTLAKELYNSLSTITNVSKYYQQRLSSNTILDYYEILRNYNDKAILIKYSDGVLNNSSISSIVYEVINNYLNESNIYIVKSGDSLYSIAKKFNTTVDDIKRINNLSSNLLNINQKLIIPSNNSNNSNNIDNNNNNNIYIVQSGDSLYSISKKYNTTVDEIKKINNLSSNLLSIGQKLILPSNNTFYTVIKGDNLYSIAKKYNTTVDEIKRLNNLTSNLLNIGQKLIIK